MKSLKKQFRVQMKKELARVSAESIKRQSQAVFNKVVGLTEYQTAKKVSIFLSMPTELDTRPLVEDILQRGKACYVPICTKDEMRMVRVKSLDDYNNLPLNSWNIPEPKASDGRPDCFEEGGLDLIIMPGLAFDLNGNRIGYGKGYYDRFMAKTRQYAAENNIQRPIAVAICLTEQLVQSVPIDDTDIKPDQIIHE